MNARSPSNKGKNQFSFLAPTGLRHKAQGCGESRYPGTFPIKP
jgi:hypothetical protein